MTKLTNLQVKWYQEKLLYFDLMLLPVEIVVVCHTVECRAVCAHFRSGSSDYSVRVWRLSGQYVGTLGSFVPWSLENTRFPPDVQKVASFTTFKVGGSVLVTIVL